MLNIKKGCDFNLNLEFGFDITGKNILITCKSIEDKRFDNNDALFLEDILVTSSTNATNGIFKYNLSYNITKDLKIGECILQVELKDTTNNTIQDFGQDSLFVVENIRK